jgi:hypothetical protein
MAATTSPLLDTLRLQQPKEPRRPLLRRCPFREESGRGSRPAMYQSTYPSAATVDLAFRRGGTAHVFIAERVGPNFTALQPDWRRTSRRALSRDQQGGMEWPSMGETKGRNGVEKCESQLLVLSRSRLLSGRSVPGCRGRCPDCIVSRARITLWVYEARYRGP